MASVVDRALTVGGYAQGDDGVVRDATKKTYGRLWGCFDRWCRSRGLRPMPASNETLALFVQWLTQEGGYAPATAEVACTAVRWRHRVAGEVPPDRVAAWFVLRNSQPSGPVGDALPLRAACRDDLMVAAEVCSLESARGVRDLVTVVLPYVLGVGESDMAALRLEHLELVDEAVTVRLPGSGRSPAGWAVQRFVCAPGCGWDPVVCPARLLGRWLGVLAAAGVSAGPLLRPVDLHGHIAGTGVHAGRSALGGGLAPAAVRRLVRQVTGRADLDEAVTRRPLVSLRLGSALEARAGGAGMVELAARAGYAEGSMRLARYLAMHGLDGGRP